MEEEIEKLLANLNSSTLHSLPCFFDKPNLIQFRIGLNTGPQIRFEPMAAISTPKIATEYNLVLTGTNGEIFIYPILVGSQKFNTCQSIYTYIRGLYSKETYSKWVEENIGFLLTNLKNIVDPIIANLP